MRVVARLFLLLQSSVIASMMYRMKHFFSSTVRQNDHDTMINGVSFTQKLNLTVLGIHGPAMNGIGKTPRDCFQVIVLVEGRAALLIGARRNLFLGIQIRD